MKAYLVCEIVDLGYQVVSGYTSKEKATNELNRLIDIAKKQKIEELINCGYTEEKATYYASNDEYYELEEVEIES